MKTVRDLTVSIGAALMAIVFTVLANVFADTQLDATIFIAGAALYFSLRPMVREILEKCPE